MYVRKEASKQGGKQQGKVVSGVAVVILRDFL
jgi:hypothetical protein